jgi:hypothetical protein
MMVSSPRDPNFLPNVPIVNDDDEDPQEPVDPPADRNARNNSVPPLPDFSHPDTPGPSRSVPIFDDAIPDPTTENQTLNAAAYIPNEPSLPQQNSNEISNAPAEPEHNDDDTSNLLAEPQQPSSSSNAPTEPQQQQQLLQDDPTEPEQEDPANNDPFDPQSTEPEANASSSHSNQSSHPSDPN